jgi:hypothetical protein
MYLYSDTDSCHTNLPLEDCSQFMDIDDKGQESNPAYTAYVMPTFNLEREDLNEYRIEYQRPYEKMILKIK